VTDRWLCIQCRAAHWGRPTCDHSFWHVQAAIDTDQYLWWQWRMKAKSDEARRAISEAGSGLRYNDWPRIVAALSQNAEIYRRKFIVASEPLIL